MLVTASPLYLIIGVVNAYAMASEISCTSTNSYLNVGLEVS